MLEDEHHHVLFVGYQAPGTYGYDIQKYGPHNGKTGGWVEIEGKRYTIMAGVTTIDGYSAHADQNDLVNFVKRMRHWPKQIRIVHGDVEARESLKAKYGAMAEEANEQVTIVLPEKIRIGD